MNEKKVLLFTLPFILLIIYACQDDFMTQMTKNDKMISKELNAKTVLSLYNQHVTTIALPERNLACGADCNHNHDHTRVETRSGHAHTEQCNHGTTDSGIWEDLKMTNLVPDWDDIREWSDSTSNYVEIPLLNGGQLFALKKIKKGSGSTETERSRVETRLVFEQNHDKDSIMIYMVTLIGEKHYLRKKGNKIRQLHHRPDDKEFTGFVIESHLNGQRRNGYYYTDGLKTHKMFRSKGIKPESYDETSMSVQIGFFDMAINKASYDPSWEWVYCAICMSMHDIDDDCDVVVTYCSNCNRNINSCYCCWICNQYPCKCGTQVCSTCKKNPCECSETPCIDCGFNPCRCPETPTDPPPVTPPTIDYDLSKLVSSTTNLNQTDIAFLKLALYVMDDSNGYKRLFDFLKRKNIKIEFGINRDIVTSNGVNTYARACYVKGTNKIYFRDRECIKSGYLAEEIIHMVQYEQFYGNNMRTDVLNYEFEAKIYKRIYTNEISGGESINFIGPGVDGSTRDQFELWCFEIWNRGRFTSNDLEKYFYYLERWDSEYPNASIDFNINPELVMYYH